MRNRPGADLGFAQSPRTQGPRHPATIGRHAGPSEGIETPGSVRPQAWVHNLSKRRGQLLQRPGRQCLDLQGLILCPSPIGRWNLA